ncbi:MAG TPA: DUF3108 domain-containing protein [Thermoanaerobaculia bacterium]|nr:DUF3108 domain-containing protein [Thermoanaerobaculia bacterium]
MIPLRTWLAIAALMIAASGSAADLNCKGPSNVEQFKYSWRLRGGLSWVAGLVFPTSGVGEMKTTYPKEGETLIDSSLLLTSKVPGFYAYETQIDENTQKTMTTYHGYAWKNKSRKERTSFDYARKVALTHKETPEKQWDRTDPLPPEQIHDILAAIYYIRQNAMNIRGPVNANIFSDGELYPVILRPDERRTFNIGGQNVGALGFAIVDAPGGRKWPGGVKVWISEDPRRIPFRIEIQQSMASLQLELTSVESCAFMQASK